MRRTRGRSSSSSVLPRQWATVKVRVSISLLIVFGATVLFLSWQLPSTPSSIINNDNDTPPPGYPVVTQGRAVQPGSGLQHVISNVRGASVSSSNINSKPRSHRLAIVLPFAGDGPESIPPYLRVFCVGAAAAKDTADFLIFHNGALAEFPVATACPSNVKFINLGTTHAMALRFLKVLDQKPDEDFALNRARLEHLTATHLKMYPYCLVEFKPALGHVFADYLQDYSHWGYSDLDILFGDLGRWMTADEWQDFDVVTYGFGDQERLYVRGQFTFHKNTPHINQLWRKCEYLTNLDERFANVIQGKSKFRLESAEGCYSVAILSDRTIKVKYAVKAWTDVNEEDTAYTHGLFVARSPQTSRQVIYKAESVEAGRDIVKLRPTWFEQDDRVYMDRSQPLQHYSGERQALALPDKERTVNKCMYWVQDKYQSQLCLSEKVNADETVFWVDGKLYKQRHENAALESGMVTAPFFHFQEWKRYFRTAQLATLHMSTQVSTFVLAKEGAIPIGVGRALSKSVPSPLGLPMKRWKAVPNDGRSQLPGESYCLVSGPRKYPPQPPARACYHQVSWQETKRVEIFSKAPDWKSLDVELDVTLALTLQITESQVKDKTVLSEMVELVVKNLARWQGQPCVVVIHVAGTTEASRSFLRHQLGPNSDLLFGVENALVAGVFGKEDDVVSRKALLNMAIDVVPTRWHISGIELERGLTLSVDAAFFAHRAVRSHGRFQGHVFFVPQFALAEADDDITLEELVVARHKRKLKFPDEYEGLCGDEPANRNEHANLLWWVQTNLFVDKRKPMETDEEATERRAASLKELENRFLKLLTDEHHYAMFAMEDSPILLVDNLGRDNGIRSSEIAREIEELAGPRCYNGLRLAQLAAYGYKFDVLAGAFAASTDSSREVLKTKGDEDSSEPSLCDGCIMFDEDHEEILEAIVRDEMQRPAKAAILWEELLDHDA